MPGYEAPLADYRFVLEQLCGADNTDALPEWGDLTIDDAMAVLTEAGRFASDVLAPLNQTGDREGCALTEDGVRTATGFADAYQAFCDGGWCAAGAPVEYGGQGLPNVVTTLLREIWNAANMSFALCPLLTESAVVLLSEHGDEAQKRDVLPKLVSGAWTAAMALTEPQAGSDVGAGTCRADVDGDQYRLFGQKIFISWGDHDMAENIVHLVLARLPDAPEGSRGLSLFLTPKFLPDGTRNDLRAARLEEKLGIHASPTCEMLYGENDGAIASIVGEPNKGLTAMFAMMNAARLAVGHQGIGIAERARQAAFAYAKERRQGRSIATLPAPGDASPIIDHPDIRHMLISMQGMVLAMRLLAAEAARQSDIGTEAAEKRLGLLTPIVKAWCTDEAVTVASDAIQVFGGAGYIEETGAAQYLRDARILPIYEGTNGIQAIDLIFRKVIGDKGEALMSFLQEIDDSLLYLAETAGPESATANLIELPEELVHSIHRSVKRIFEMEDDSDRQYIALAFLRQLALISTCFLCARALHFLEMKTGDEEELQGNELRIAAGIGDFLYSRPMDGIAAETRIVSASGGGDWSFL